mgnify:CR=1 FL=1|tara:strand:+ start:2664 stop:3353 length:690 start_codon:yes stop_codon:yes gene_type:complete
MANYTTTSAGITAGLGFLFQAGTKIFGKSERDKDVDRRNALKRKEHQAEIHAYNRKLLVSNISWRDDILNSRAAIRLEGDKALGEIAEGQLETWNNLVNTNNAIQTSFAKMLSVGGGEQAGRRSAATIDPRKALLEHGQKVADLGAKLSGSAAQTALANRLKIDLLNKKAHNEEIKQQLGQPIPGTPPQLFEEEFETKESWATTALGIGGDAMNAYRTFQTLKPEDPTA